MLFGLLIGNSAKKIIQAFAGQQQYQTEQEFVPPSTRSGRTLSTAGIAHGTSAYHGKILFNFNRNYFKEMDLRSLKIKNINSYNISKAIQLISSVYFRNGFNPFLLLVCGILYEEIGTPVH